jgi:hypothetical protein
LGRGAAIRRQICLEYVEPHVQGIGSAPGAESIGAAMRLWRRRKQI